VHEPKARLTVVEQVYHQLPGENPTRIESKFYQALDIAEQLYHRRMKATERWQKIDCGWIQEVSEVCIHNDEGRFLVVQPSDEERAEAARKVLEVSFGDYGPDPPSGPVWLVRPGQSMRGCPSEFQRLCIRSQCGEARCSIYLIPA
jgi:hypothetical protein